MIRLFVGLALPDLHRRQLSLLDHGIEGARWVEPENLHITLRFIGEVDGNVADDIAQALDDVKGDPFAVAVKGLGTFGHPPHALWAGVEAAPKDALAHLQANVESAMVRLGLAPEGRKFTPHVTLARFKKTINMNRLARVLEDSGDLALPPFEAQGFTLFQSHLGHEGAHYERMVEYDLA